MDSSSDSTSSRDEPENTFTVAALLVSFVECLFVVIAVQNTEEGQALFKKQPTLTMATVWSLVLFFLVMVMVLVGSLPIPTRSFIPVCIFLLLGSIVSVLASFLISSSTGWFTFSIWVCFFAIVAFRTYQNAKKPPESSSSADP